MPNKGDTDMERLREDLAAAGFSVVKVGRRYQVTSPSGGNPLFLPEALPKNGRGSMAEMVDMLAGIGYTPTAAAPPQRRSVESVTNRDLTTLRTEIVQLNAALAAELLRMNNFYSPDGSLDVAAGEARTNRPFKPELARKYRDDMLRGEWRLTHQGIGVNRNGVLLDGQHRAVAVIEASEVRPGIAIPTQITWGLDPEVFDAVDIGRKRTVADVLASHGVKSAGQVAAVVRLVAFYDDHRAPGEWKHTQLSPEQTLAKLHAEPTIHDATRWGSYRALALPAAEGAARHVIMRGCRAGSHHTAEVFFESYRTGAGLDVVGNPVLTLRNVILGQARDRKRKRDALEQLALVIKAWNAHVAGKRQKVLAWRYTEDVPRATLLG